MRRGAYSLVEVMVAVAVIGIGMTAAAMLINTLMAQEEVNAASLRAANLQEQAVMLHRLGLGSDQIRAILPEVCGTNSSPAEGTFSIVFSEPQQTNIAVSIGGTIPLEFTTCTMVFAMPLPGDDADPLRTNTVQILRPVIR
ncbi:MAG: prepilin-type N-terminal cleavage/methylation domain-containing protein [Chthoniobacterales bacterium]|nr:prepilin-type N-terminal cleavage/methylation domain-containing protein [Chthoniobacterales bacterium]